MPGVQLVNSTCGCCWGRASREGPRSSIQDYRITVTLGDVTATTGPSKKSARDSHRIRWRRGRTPQAYVYGDPFDRIVATLAEIEASCRRPGRAVAGARRSTRGSVSFRRGSRAARCWRCCRGARLRPSPSVSQRPSLRAVGCCVLDESTRCWRACSRASRAGLRRGKFIVVVPDSRGGLHASSRLLRSWPRSLDVVVSRWASTTHGTARSRVPVVSSTA